MAYITGTITDPNPEAALYTVLAAALTSAGYTLEDTVVIGGNTHKIWKSAAANNTQGLDWYLEVAYKTLGVGNGLMLFPMEAYDSTNNLGIRRVGNSTTQNLEATFGSAYGATGYDLEAAQWGTMRVTEAGLPIPVRCQVTSFGYWASVTGNRVIIMGSLDPDRMIYAGMYTPDPIYAAKANAAQGCFPLILVYVPYHGNIGFRPSNYSNSAAAGGFTRRAPLTGNPGYTTEVWGSGGVFRDYGFEGLVRIPDGNEAFANKSLLQLRVSGYAPSSSGNLPAGTLGYLDGLRVCHAAPTVVRGDTAPVGGETWTLCTVTSGYALAMKQV